MAARRGKHWLASGLGITVGMGLTAFLDTGPHRDRRQDSSGPTKTRDPIRQRACEPDQLRIEAGREAKPRARGQRVTNYETPPTGSPNLGLQRGSAPIPPAAIIRRLVVSVKAALRRAKTARGLDTDHQPPKNTFLGKGEWELWEFPLSCLWARSSASRWSAAQLGGFIGFY